MSTHEQRLIPMLVRHVDLSPWRNIWLGLLRVASDPIYQSYQILHIAFIIAPIVAGADKFLHLLTNWDSYVAPAMARMLPTSVHSFMLIVGVVEIIAGILV